MAGTLFVEHETITVFEKGLLTVNARSLSVQRFTATELPGTENA